MRVDLRTHGPEPPDKSKPGRASQTPPPSAHESDAARVDQARFSFDQKRVQTLEAQAMAQPEVREQRVEALRQAIGKGEYAVSDSQVADAMIAEFGAGSRR